jgi:hypothetical protein
MGIKKKIDETITNQERIEFAKNIEHFYEAGFAKRKQILLFAFLKGVATGFGVFIGGTIVVGLLLWILSGLNQVPFVGDISDAAENSITKD